MYHDQIAAPKPMMAKTAFTKPVISVESMVVMPKYEKRRAMTVTSDDISPESI
jgi:hypothetical protein